MEIHSLVIEVTRRCNLQCKHCLRGASQNNKCFKEAWLNNLFSNIDYIGTITFTGGEPLTRINTIENIMNYIRDVQIKLGAFYIVHNGTIYSKKFMNFLLDFYENYCEDKELCGFSLSTDMYHKESIANCKIQDHYWDYKELMDMGYGFVSDDRKQIESIILSGRAKKNHLKSSYVRKAYYNNKFYLDDYDSDNITYVSANGNVISNCDLSYDIIDKHSFGNISNETLESIIERNSVEHDKVIQIEC